MSLSPHRDDGGASAVIIALALFVLIGFAAIAVDLAVGFNQRRQDQTAADVGVMAGAVESLGSPAQIRDQILDFTRRNVVATYSNADWQAHWEACTDPEIQPGGEYDSSSGYVFVPVPLPPGWSTPSGRLDCISVDGGGYVRVNLPPLEFETSFGRVFGVSQLETRAGAVATLGNWGGGGILLCTAQHRL
jgi:hypothetical protein